MFQPSDHYLNVIEYVLLNSTLSHIVLMMFYDAYATDNFWKWLCPNGNLLIMSNLSFFDNDFNLHLTRVSKPLPWYSAADVLYVGKELTLSLLQQSCSRRLWTYFVKNGKSL